MIRWLSRFLFSSLSLWGALVLALTTGCASGGYKLTRQYARFVNHQNILLRIVLYLLTSVVFAVTLLIDMVVFNTMDFWNGRVSQGVYEFRDGDKTYVARHQIFPESGLRQSTIQVLNRERDTLQEVVLRETASEEIELFVDGKLQTRVRDLRSLPIASFFNNRGELVREHALTSSLVTARP